MSHNTLCTKDTELYADTVEWCPLEPFQDILACGTYQLVEGNKTNENAGVSSKRVGNVKLYRLDETGLDLVELYCTSTDAGILDMKWYPNNINDRGILGAVSAESQLKIYSLSQEQGLHLTEENSINIGPEKICLSLDWSSYNCEPKCVVSDSQGQLTLLQCPEASWEARQIMQWTGHDYEAWITAFDKWTPDVVYSGGDDCRLKGWDTRADCSQPIFSSRKHEMGVSSIQCNPVYEFIMATGSYDENILVWDTRNMKAPLCSSRPGGGVWRIKWHPDTGNYILTASMYDGFHVLKYSHEKDSSSIKLLISYKDNLELAYGADWCRIDRSVFNPDKCCANSNEEAQPETNDSATYKCPSIVATCSFYDHILHLWEVCC